MTRKYDESLSAIQEMQQAGTAIYKVEDMEFGRRLAVERELELPGPDDRIPGMWINAIWDESGSFVIYPTLLGIKCRHRQCSPCSMSLMMVCSCKHRHESSCTIARQGRDCPVHASHLISGCAGEEGADDSGTSTKNSMIISAS